MSASLTEMRIMRMTKIIIIIHLFLSYFTFYRKAFCPFQVQHGSLVMGKYQGSTTTLLVLETSGSWRKVDFYWKAEHMMVGTILKTCVCRQFILTALYSGETICSFVCSYSHLQAALFKCAKWETVWVLVLFVF